MLRWFAKRLAGEGRRAKEDQRGFTLIELLVVIIIIGILAAIAIPVYLNQREKAQDAAAQSDVRNMATAQEAWYAGNNSYTGELSNLQDEGFRMSEGVTGHTATTSSSPDTYCVQAKSASGKEFSLNSSAGGGVQGGGCS